MAEIFPLWAKSFVRFLKIGYFHLCNFRIEFRCLCMIYFW